MALAETLNPLRPIVDDKAAERFVGSGQTCGRRGLGGMAGARAVRRLAPISRASRGGIEPAGRAARRRRRRGWPDRLERRVGAPDLRPQGAAGVATAGD